ncbi:NADPH-dependent 7-cyano-7-deazaguanine reductase [Legionella massiliensis]|uniref:NADPH-dependent 7-cyano-7-deazaguanine reductase n=1 Tax=Legionella massiliensis TaxID=1034943 RepID=A0A078L384_9GAMM|nr:NADPH-dependent 7-cyano-7-deazaguanine reductase QueF [Legionella massiliensis]CDZ78574.1 NADPH-dependent 7-cyano-7-deazaguanine reductase [Legionella massiliensis]CEE14312.1 NADPH-dependent 7-cyano-7-deazaguanine reductase [Legionella massiliensis]
MTNFSSLKDSPLGKTSKSAANYDKSLLFALDRSENRRELDLVSPLPFHGSDIWNLYELSWLNLQGKPIVAMARLTVPADSPRIFESKSLKLYLNSLHNLRFANGDELCKLIVADLSELCGTNLMLSLEPLTALSSSPLSSPEGLNLDDYDIHTDCYSYHPQFLSSSEKFCEEILYSNLLRSNCPITNQPDWATLVIRYEGRQIDHPGLLKYIISLREHNEFHEHCIERIFVDLMKHCGPENLLVSARYTRRGGIDINPQRATLAYGLEGNRRLIRQ